MIKSSTVGERVGHGQDLVRYRGHFEMENGCSVLRCSVIISMITVRNLRMNRFDYFMDLWEDARTTEELLINSPKVPSLKRPNLSRSLTGPGRAIPLHPREPHRQSRRLSAAAFRVRRLHRHAPAAVQLVPAQRRRAGEAGRGAGEHVRPPSCGSSCGCQRGLRGAAAGNTGWGRGHPEDLSCSPTCRQFLTTSFVSRRQT